MNIEKHIPFLFSPEIREELLVKPIQGDASARRYYRISGPAGTTIACHDPQLQERGLDDYPFFVMYELLRSHEIAVPELLAVNERTGFLLLEDCGTTHLEQLAREVDAATVAELYREIVDLLVRLQSITGTAEKVPFSLAFDREKLLFEFDFFIEHAVNGYFSCIGATIDTTELRREFESITEHLVRPRPFVLNHRDFQSRNIMIREGRPVVIDFQDARMGLVQYDAVSLIRDSYVVLDAELVDELKRRHYQAVGQFGLCPTGYDEYLHLFDLMAFQRNVKALGTFCCQTWKLHKTGYEQSIWPTLAYLPDYIEAHTELKKAGRLLQPIIELATTR